jgi:hypothetical protein
MATAKYPSEYYPLPGHSDELDKDMFDNMIPWFSLDQQNMAPSQSFCEDVYKTSNFLGTEFFTESAGEYSRTGPDEVPSHSLGEAGSLATEDHSGSKPNKVSKRGPFRDDDQRKATAKTRQLGACIRCREQKIRVWRHSVC